MKISDIGTVEVPAILALEELGLTITSRVLNAKQDMIWTATGSGNEYTAADPIALLGLVKLIEVRGVNWPASDQELDRYIPLLEGRAP